MASPKNAVNKPSATGSRRSMLGDLYARPGFLLRRAHQIAVGIFITECTALGLTPPQHSALIVIDRCVGLDQAALARAIGFDRATIGKLVEGLEARGLVSREGRKEDRRRKTLALTPAGRRMVKRAQAAIRRTSVRLLAPLAPAERQQFVKLLLRFTGALNSESRTPVRPPD